MLIEPMVLLHWLINFLINYVNQSLENSKKVNCKIFLEHTGKNDYI